MSYKGSSQKELKKYTRQVIDGIGICDSLKEKHPEEFDFFVNYLFIRHPNYPEKTEGLVDVIIKYNPFGNLSVYFKKSDNQIEDISALDKCITGKDKDNLYIAMRNSITPQIKDYRNKHPNLVCEICSNSENIEIDHKEPHFIDIFSDFLNEQNYKPTTFSSDKSHRKIFTEKDKDFKEKWIEYHKTKSILRPLCKKCNSSRKKHKRNITFTNIMDSIKVFTDGACSHNGKPNAKAGLGVYFGENDPRNTSKRVLGKQTNNVAELSAIIEVFEILKEEIEAGQKIIIYSDSKISIGWCGSTGKKYESMNWSKKGGIPNVELIKIGYGLCKNYPNVSFEHVKAHTGLSDEFSLGNEGADRLANEAIGLKSCPYDKKDKYYLNIPYERKEEGKMYAAKWDPKKKKWYYEGFKTDSNFIQLLELFHT